MEVISGLGAARRSGGTRVRSVLRRTKDGLILTYGARGRAFWITRAEDCSGKFVAYHYRDEEGEIAPEAIEYTGHPEAPATRRVEFEYTQKSLSA